MAILAFPEFRKRCMVDFQRPYNLHQLWAIVEAVEGIDSGALGAAFRGVPTLVKAAFRAQLVHEAEEDFVAYFQEVPRFDTFMEALAREGATKVA